MAIVRSIAGHPDVSVEEAGEILLLAGQRLEAARAMSGLQQFSSAEIEVAKQFIGSLDPAVRSRAEGFETVQKVLDHYQQMVNFTQSDETLIQKILEGSGVNYREPISIKVGKFIRDLGYIVNTRVYSGSNFILQDAAEIYIAKKLPSRKIIENKGFLWAKREVVRIIEGRDFNNLGAISFGTEEGDDWKLGVQGKDSLADCVVIAKYVHDYFDCTVNITLLHE